MPSSYSASVAFYPCLGIPVYPLVLQSVIFWVSHLSIMIPSLFVLHILQTLLLCAHAHSNVFDFTI